MISDVYVLSTRKFNGGMGDVSVRHFVREFIFQGLKLLFQTIGNIYIGSIVDASGVWELMGIKESFICFGLRVLLGN